MRQAVRHDQLQSFRRRLRRPRPARPGPGPPRFVGAAAKEPSALTKKDSTRSPDPNSATARSSDAVAIEIACHQGVGVTADGECEWDLERAVANAKQDGNRVGLVIGDSDVLPAIVVEVPRGHGDRLAAEP